MNAFPFSYIGRELDLFALASGWKSYVRDHLSGDLQGRVLEVGAGLGGSTRWLCDGSARSWTCLEPDPALAARLSDSLRTDPIRPEPEVRVGFLDTLENEQRFDAILYLDVLEHIEEDRGEVARAARLLSPGGRLIVLSPAHPTLYSPFDAALGHYRRYTKASLEAIRPQGLNTDRLLELDSVGLLLSMGNRLLLRRRMPTAGQIQFWDRVCVPLSRRLDPVLGYRLGKTILAVWRHP